MNSVNLRRALVEALDQGIALLDDMEQGHYVAKVPSAFNASIGSHFRHCLDHFETLLAGAQLANQGIVDYDARQRDQQIENDCAFALEQARELRATCENLDVAVFDREVMVRCKVSCNGSDDSSPVVGSTFAREAMYAVVHAVHHYALISVMCEILEVETPKQFGIAPSTVAHEEHMAGLAARC